MTSKIISGKELSQQMRDKMREEVKGFVKKPSLTVVIVGDDPASKTYVKSKQKTSIDIGINSSIIELPKETTQKQLLEVINSLNNDNDVDGILIQLPLPNHISEDLIIESISPNKDVDGFHPINVGKMMVGQESFLPCTPFGILQMVKSKGLTIEGKHVIVVGRSNIVGKPVGQLFLNENATVTYCHSKTKNLKSVTQQGDILIVSVGKPNFITDDYVKDGAVVIDVGINRLDNGKLCGDVDFKSVESKSSYITPVPGGVGPMTITMLMYNTIQAFKKKISK